MVITMFVIVRRCCYTYIIACDYLPVNYVKHVINYVFYVINYLKHV